MYSDYTFYTGTYKGQLTEGEYNRLGVRACAEIDRITFNRAMSAVGSNLISIKYAECAVIDELDYQGTEGIGDVTSESNDGISRSYTSGKSRSAKQRIDSAASVWLYNTNLCCSAI